MPPPRDEEKRAEILKMLRAGRSVREIVEKLHTSTKLVAVVREEHGIAVNHRALPPPVRDEPEEAEVVDAEAEPADDDEVDVEELKSNITWYEEREKELLELVADLSAENVRLRKAKTA